MGIVMPEWLRLELASHLTADFSNCVNINVLTWIDLEPATLYEEGEFARKCLVFMQLKNHSDIYIIEHQEVCSSQ